MMLDMFRPQSLGTQQFGRWIVRSGWLFEFAASGLVLTPLSEADVTNVCALVCDFHPLRASAS